MKKVVLMFVAMFALTTAMAQEDCGKKCEKAKMEKKCDGQKKDCCEGKMHKGCDKKHEGCDKKHEGCDKKHEGCDKKLEGCDKKHEGCDKKHEGCDKKHEGCDKKHEGCDKKMEGQKPCRTGMMVKELGLDEAQAAKVKELNEKYADVFEGPAPGMRPRPEMKQKKELKVDGVSGATEQKVKPEPKMMAPSPEMKQMMQERHSKMKAYEEELKGILTEEQFNTYQEKMRPRHHGMRREMMKN